MSEIAEAPRAVLAHHHKDTPLHGDFTTIQRGDYADINVLVGGTPCQSFSVAGLRGGMADARGNLALEYLRLADRLRPRWLVWENVPGVLSSNGGRDFGSFLGGLGQLGYGFAYRVLDAQFFGLAQRRKRVFVVGYLGDWRRAAAVLFEPASLRGDHPPRRKAGQNIAPTISSRPTGGGGLGTDFDLDGGLCVVPRGSIASVGVAFGGNNQSGPIDVATALNACHTASGRQDFESETFVMAADLAPSLTSNPYGDHESREGLLVAHSLRGEGFDASEDGTGRGVSLAVVSVALRGRDGGAACEVGDDKAFTLRASSGGGDKPHVLAFSCKDHGADAGAIAPTLRAMGHAKSHANAGGQLAIATRSAVRRLTPRECERLQGFPELCKSVIFRVCKNVDERLDHAPSVGHNSAAQRPDQNEHADVHVLIDLERQAVQILSRGKCLWSASSAEKSNSSPLSMPAADFVRLAALMTTSLVPVTVGGVGALPPNTNGSLPRWTGSVSARLSGVEIAALANDAELFTQEVARCMRSTTSEAGQNSQNSALTLETFGYCVVSAIASFIPEQMWMEPSFAIKLETTEGYTAVPRKGRNSTMADGPRYKCLGNSMAVPVMAWVGRRIAAEDARS